MTELNTARKDAENNKRREHDPHNPSGEQKETPKRAAPFTKALLVEDEANLATTIEVALKKLGIIVEHVSTIADAKKSIQANPPALLVLDRTLPDGDGLTLCSDIRSDFKGMVLMLTARGEVKDRVQGLHAGADDYLPKPFSWAELEARVVALSRRQTQFAAPQPAEEIIPEAWHIDPDRLRVLKPSSAGTEWVVLTPLEFKLASHLISAKGAIVTREDLLKDVWGFTLLPKTRTVDHFLGRLRKYFEANPEEPKHFLTVRGAGYRFERLG
jgi:two-component system, OmpR family, alkaline phosphatase synthesis response regulator PhoP